MRKKTIADMHALALKRDGLCISIQYLGAHTPLLWRCKEGHEWDAMPTTISSGGWCPFCSGLRGDHLSIDNLNKIAETRGGKCLSNEYINAIGKLNWRCENNHEWAASANSVKRGSWCPVCARGRAGTTQRGSLDECQKIAISRGGSCLAKVYLNSLAKLPWRCAENHEWSASTSSIKKGSWCPICSQGVSERICRVVLENGLGRAFPKCRPNWLINEEGNQMELDGFCEELSIAFEYNGRQHYRKVNHFHKSGETLEKRIRDDKTKKDLCDQKKVSLIVIPYTVNIEDIPQFIFESCSSLGREVEKKNFKWTPENVYHSRSKLIELMRDIAREHGGECLSDSYVNMNTKLAWKCKFGHIWDSVPSSIQQGIWCPTCGRKKAAKSLEYTIEEIKMLATKNHGELISDVYLGGNKRHEWRCQNGHIFYAAPNSIRQDHWCPICKKSGKGAKKSIEYFKNLAKVKGGECLSDDYLGIHKNLKWRCKEGHEWESPASSIQNGRWCRKCGRILVGIKLKKTIGDMQIIARNHSGECISNEYIDAHTKLKWRCKENHEWDAAPSSISQGTWCPKCSRKRGWAKRKSAV